MEGGHGRDLAKFMRAKRGKKPTYWVHPIAISTLVEGLYRATMIVGPHSLLKAFAQLRKEVVNATIWMPKAREYRGGGSETDVHVRVTPLKMQSVIGLRALLQSENDLQVDHILLAAVRERVCCATLRTSLEGSQIWGTVVALKRGAHAASLKMKGWWLA